jgi:hypothetical protein
MAKHEGSCKWIFATNPANGYGHGVNDAVGSHFDKFPYSSLIRESIQNSLDAVDNKEEPVAVKFTFNRIQASEYPQFFELKEHIRGIAKRYPDNNDALEMTERMLSTFQTFGRNQRIDYIQVSDYNTTGMDYKEGSCPFSAFLRSAGDSVKNNAGAGGSFGFGKAAYFEMSPIKAVIASTYTKEGKHFFEGAAILATHMYKGEEKIHAGYYDTEEGCSPTSDIEKIPPKFRREEQGTDICIMGVSASDKERKEACKHMIKATLRNFWLAILDGKLVVTIEDTIISASNLEEMMNSYFPESTDDKNRSENYNPRPYFEAVKNAGLNSKYVRIDGKLNTIGNVSLYIKKVKNAKDKIAYMRSLRMLVYSKQYQTSYGCYALFFCDDPKGNKILRELENAAHKEWDAYNCRNKKDFEEIGKAAIKEINEFISSTLERLFTTDDNAPVSVSGLEEFLFIPEELIPKEDDDINENPFFGKESGKFDDEGYSMTSVVNDVNSKDKDSSTSDAIIVELKQAKANPDDSGELGSSNGNKKKKGTSEYASPGTSPYEESDDDDATEGTFTRNVPVKYRVVATRNLQGKIEHNLIIYSNREVQNGFIVVGISGEQEDEEMDIVYSDTGVPEHNVLKQISLSSGKNTIVIRLDDNMKHSLLLKAYETK